MGDTSNFLQIVIFPRRQIILYWQTTVYYRSKRISVGDKVRIYPGIRMEALDGGEIYIGNNIAVEQNVHIISGE